MERRMTYSAEDISDNMTTKSEPESDSDTPTGTKRKFKTSIEIQPTKRRVTYNQLLTLWKFLNKHRKLAVGANKSKFDRHHSIILWKKVADVLNSSEEGAYRSGPEWSKYWVDLKAKIKRKNRLINDARRDGHTTDLELSDLERKFLSIFSKVNSPVSQEHEENIEVQIKPGTSQSIANDDSDVYLIVASSDNKNNLSVHSISSPAHSSHSVYSLSPSETSDGDRISSEQVQADPQSTSTERRRQGAEECREDYSAEFDSDNMSTKSESESDEHSDNPSTPKRTCESLIEIQPKIRRVSNNQLHNLWTFLSKHREVAVGPHKSITDRDHFMRMWQKVADILNSTGDGIAKTGLEWSKYWIDLKSKIRKKNRLIDDEKKNVIRGSRGDCAIESELTEMERKFLSIISTQDHKDNVSQSNPGASRSTENDEDDVYYIVAANTNNQHKRLKPDLASPPPAETSDEDEDIRHDPLETPSKQVEDDPPPSSGHLERNREQRPKSVTLSDTPAIRPEGSVQGLQRRRRNIPNITAAEARTRLVSASEARARAELASSRSIDKAVGILNDIAITLRRIEAKLPARAPLGRP